MIFRFDLLALSCFHNVLANFVSDLHINHCPTKNN
ncbi:hypothetical protein SLEP1_g53220 [Rubroshorea leprosula]|uniref:Uncharacterized protein n=1 Tax=Rubroshorea leprosula TaxID=152421 RepID=A0AAV5M8R8_9ROSI|nr:hypothetical protein SLEP1_g53220 [Rubroshorea leprosula]